MKSRTVMSRGDYRLLPKGLRRLLVVSETFFFGNTANPKPLTKLSEEEVLKTSSSLAFCE